MQVSVAAAGLLGAGVRVEGRCLGGGHDRVGCKVVGPGRNVGGRQCDVFWRSRGCWGRCSSGSGCWWFMLWDVSGRPVTRTPLRCFLPGDAGISWRRQHVLLSAMFVNCVEV
ncbi:hypothetical protein CCHR01_15283 [Colletotrichum chrysophilum]|uniref:Uncharacterized protein n=1 Tax=Colletotrichum chrysophilum TaxID=1836956 RepID=A0AAD9A8J5_9PEZI|nr:hypothetical protein CCHR01_15283 [Colletotrichum chrysophilum]